MTMAEKLRESRSRHLLRCSQKANKQLKAFRKVIPHDEFKTESSKLKSMLINDRSSGHSFRGFPAPKGRNISA